MLTSFATAKTLGTADTFAAAKLMQKEVSQLIPALEQLAYDIPDSWNTELRAKRIDLGTATPTEAERPVTEPHRAISESAAAASMLASAPTAIW